MTRPRPNDESDDEPSSRPVDDVLDAEEYIGDAINDNTDESSEDD